MLATLAAILFGAALILHLLHAAADITSGLTLAGLLFLALHFAVGTVWRHG